jgi:hAT family C-terminal dimerisation region
LGLARTVDELVQVHHAVSREDPDATILGFIFARLALASHLELKVFSVASSSAASERNFSSVGFIHSKLRNCLGQYTVEKLVYVKTTNLQFTVNANLDTYNSASDNENDVEEDLGV